MSKTTPIDPNNPKGTADPKQGDNQIRKTNAGVIEILNVDHYVGAETANGYEEDAAGEHLKATLHAQSSPVSVEASKGVVFAKTVSGVAELFYINENELTQQLTSGGQLYGLRLLSEVIRAIDETGIYIRDKDEVNCIRFLDGGKVDASASECIDEDGTLAANDADLLVSQKAIKTYVDNVPSGAGFVKTSTTAFNVTVGAKDTFEDLDISSAVGANSALVYFKVVTGDGDVKVRPNGSLGSWSDMRDTGVGGLNFSSNGHYGYGVVMTDSSGIVEIGCTTTNQLTLTVLGYVK